MPGPLAHRGLTVNQMVGHLFYTTEGVFGIPMGVSSTFIFLFILFGAYLEKQGLENSLLISPMPLQAGRRAVLPKWRLFLLPYRERFPVHP